MRSRTDARLGAIAISLLLASAWSGAASLRRVSEPQSTDRPTRAEIGRAIQKVQADPNLATERTIKVLRWNKSAVSRRSGTPAWLTWITGLFGWIGQSARILVWCSAAVLAGLLVVFIVRIVRTRNLPNRAKGFVPPTHVRDLDIRPESLPEDVGGTARTLWDGGEHRAALALLYRGMLSRLAHVHQVPIRNSSTERECLALAESRLTGPGIDYAVRLVRLWLRAVYGRHEIEGATVYVLCNDFGAALGAGATLDSPPQGGAA